jgi:hypothetical protein
MSVSSVDTSSDDKQVINHPVATSVFSKSKSELLYEASDHSIKILVLLCCGLKDNDGNILFDLRDDPWNSTTLKKRATKWRPNAQALKEHVLWWCNDFGTPSTEEPKGPCPKQWLVPKLFDWLANHPIEEPSNVHFLWSKVLKEKDLAQKCIDKEANENDLLQQAWSGKYPYLRLIHVLVDDNNTKHAFLTRYTIAPGRMEVENCNSTSCRQPTVWHMISNRWNDPSFAPETEEIPDLHSEFDLLEEIPHQLVELQRNVKASSLG